MMSLRSKVNSRRSLTITEASRLFTKALMTNQQPAAEPVEALEPKSEEEMIYELQT